jgi:hypothetical protein
VTNENTYRFEVVEACGSRVQMTGVGTQARLGEARATLRARQAQMREILDRVETRLKRQIAAAEDRLEAWKTGYKVARHGAD